jgi:hypothetical protein
MIYLRLYNKFRSRGKGLNICALRKQSPSIGYANAVYQQYAHLPSNPTFVSGTEPRTDPDFHRNVINYDGERLFVVNFLVESELSVAALA